MNKMYQSFVLATVVAAAASLAPASTDAQTSTPNFSLPNVVDDDTISLETYSTYAGIALVFTSNVCPYDLYYSTRIRDMVTRYQGKIQFILINSHLDAAEPVAVYQWQPHLPLRISMPRDTFLRKFTFRATLKNKGNFAERADRIA